jgi:hypothetical protein
MYRGNYNEAILSKSTDRLKIKVTSNFAAMVTGGHDKTGA